MVKRLRPARIPGWIWVATWIVGSLWIIVTPLTLAGAIRKPGWYDYATSVIVAGLVAQGAPHASVLLRSLTIPEAPTTRAERRTERRWLASIVALIAWLAIDPVT